MYLESGDSQISSNVDTLHLDTAQEAAFLVLLAVDLLSCISLCFCFTLMIQIYFAGGIGSCSVKY
jgi:hypothetical protein